MSTTTRTRHPGPRPMPRTTLLRRRTDLAQTLLELLSADGGHTYPAVERVTLERACDALVGPLCGAEHNRPLAAADARRVRRIVDRAQTNPGTGTGWLDDLIGRVITAEETGRPLAEPPANRAPAAPQRTDPVHDAAVEALLVADHVDSYTRHHLTLAAVTLVTRICDDPELARLIVVRAQYLLRQGTSDDDWFADAVAFVTSGDADEDTAPADAEVTLHWVSAGTSEPNDQTAASRWVMAVSAAARYEVGPVFAAPGPDGQRWGAALVQLDDTGSEIDRVELGYHDDEETAKRRSAVYERTGR